MEAIEISSSSESSDVEDVTPPTWRGLARTDLYAAAVREALAMASALGATPKEKVKKTTPKKKKTTTTTAKKATPSPSLPPVRRVRTGEGAQGETSASARTTPTASPMPVMQPSGQATTAIMNEEKREVRPLDAGAARGRDDVAGTVHPSPLLVRPSQPLSARAVPSVPSIPSVPLDVVDLMSSSDAVSVVEKSDDDDDDNIVLSALARTSLAATDTTNDKNAPETASPVRKRRRLRQFDGPMQTVLEKKSTGTTAFARRSPPKTTQKNKQNREKKIMRQRRQPAFRSIEDDHEEEDESWSDASLDASTSSGMGSIGSGSHPSALSMSSSEEEKSAMPPMRAGVLPPPATARKSAPSARHTSFVLGGASHSTVTRKSVPSARVPASQSVDRAPTSASGRTSASVRAAFASPTDSVYTSGLSSSSPSPGRPGSTTSREDSGRALRVAMMTGIIHSSPSLFPTRDRELKPPRPHVGPLRDTNTTRVANGRAQEEYEQMRLAAVQRTNPASPRSEGVHDYAKHATSPVCPEGRVTMDLCSSSDESMAASVCSTVDIERPDDPEFSAAVASPSSPLPTGRVPSSEVPRSDTTATAEVAYRALPAGASARKRLSRVALKQQPSAWQGPIPVSLLGGDSLRPFENLFAEPLSQFDPSGELQRKCGYLATFGQSSGHLTSSTYSIEAAEVPERVDRETFELQVRSIIEQELPHIRRCNAKRADAITVASRSRVSAYLSALDSHRFSLVDTALKRQVTSDRRRKISRVPCGQLPLASASQRNATRIFLHCDDGDGLGVERIGLLAKVRLMPTFKPLSRSVTCVTVSRNFRVDDDPIVRFLPTAKDAAELEATRLAEQSRLTKNTSAFGLAPSALDDEVTEYVIRAVVAHCGDGDVVFDALKKIVGLAQPYTDYSTMKKAHDASLTAQHRVADAARIVRDVARDGREPVGLLESISALKPMACRSLSERLAPPPTYFDSHIVRWQLERKAKPSASDRQRPQALNVRRTGDYSAMMETYRDFFCRICYCYDCQEHGIEQPQPTRRVDPTYPRLKSQSALYAVLFESEDDDSSADDDDDYDEALVSEPSGSDENSHSEGEQRRRSSRSSTVIATTATSNWEQQEQRRRERRGRRGQQVKHVLDETEYLDFTLVEQLAPAMQKLMNQTAACSNECWKVARAEASSLVRDEAIGVVVLKLARVVGADACVIAVAMRALACRDVHAVLEELAQENDQQDADSGRARRGKKASRGHTTSGHREAFDRTRNQRQLDHANMHAYEPCSHSGPCISTGCGCVRRDHNCEKACACPRDCPNRFQGCKCSYGSCRTVGCPCFAAGRECDPDLCAKCGAAEVALFPFMDRVHTKPQRGQGKSPLDGVDSRPATCANVRLQAGARQTIAIGASRTHGFGAFATTLIRRGDFLSEYPGELISNDEAERRGQVYDRVSTSYLFDLNEDAVVDAIRMGNKTRFINHDPSHPNCNAKVVRVGPEHRITIWAKRDIRPGEELFFDYGFKPECAPEWSRVQPSLETDHRRTDQ